MSRIAEALGLDPLELLGRIVKRKS